MGSSHPAPASIRAALVLGTAAAGAYALAASVRLGAQGLQYDELHQAVGAFAWCGRPPAPFFISASAFGLPVLSMSYTGAIKTAFYGLYLRLTGLPFTPVSWRGLGIAIVALALVLLCLLGRRSSRLTMGILVTLLLSDASILLLTRHDFGPVALAFSLRLLLIGVWLDASPLEAPGRRHAFALGLLTGVASFEKLSSAVLLIPLAILVLGDPRFRDRVRLTWCAAGLALGFSPLVAVNVASFRAGGSLISLSDATFALPSLARIDSVWGYVSLGAGRDPALFCLGATVPFACSLVEGLALVVAAMLCVAGGSGALTRDRWPRLYVASWVGAGLGLAFLPHDEVLSYHWIVGTPFQYVAIALCVALPAARPGGGGAAGRPTPRQVALGAVLAVLLLNRLVVMSGVVGWLAEGRAAPAFDPDLNRLGAFVARQGDDVTFVAATWGVATSIYSFSNGREGVVSEPYWSYSGPGDLERATSGRRVFYVVSTVPPSEVSPESTRRIVRDAGVLPGWTAASAEPELASLHALLVTKYVRSSDSFPGG
jgi:hypothetical protein